MLLVNQGNALTLGLLEVSMLKVNSSHVCVEGFSVVVMFPACDQVDFSAMSAEPQTKGTYNTQFCAILSHCGSASWEQYEKKTEFQQHKSGNKVK